MQHVYLSGYMAEVIDFLFSMYSCNVHDSFVEVTGQQLGMLLKTKRKKKKIGITMQWKEAIMLGFKLRLWKPFLFFSPIQIFHMILLTEPTKNVVLTANQPAWWHYASCDFKLSTCL